MINLKLKISNAIPAVVAVGLLLISASSVSAHVTVKPSEIGAAQRANFTVSVPTEEDVPTVGVRLVIPEGLQSVRPNAKPGWTIQLVKEGEGEEAKVVEIVWTGGSIPAELRDEFVFSAQAPASESTLSWKAYQTYSGGKVVAWDQDPKVVEEYEKANPHQDGTHDETAPMPFSTTKVVNDLAPSPVPASNTEATGMMTSAVVLSFVAIALSVFALYMQMRKKK